MTIQTARQKENTAISYGQAALYGAVYTTVPGAAAGTEPTGGGYARLPLTWAAGTVDGVVAVTVTFTVAQGTIIRGVGLHDALTGGTYLDGAAVAQQTVGASNQYTCTFTYTQA